MKCLFLLLLLVLTIFLLTNAAPLLNEASLRNTNVDKLPEHQIVKRDDEEEEGGGFFGSLKSALWYVWDSIPSGVKKCKKYSPASCRG